MNGRTNSRDNSGNEVLSVVLPVYNERESLEQLAVELSTALCRCGCQFEILFVNDGSTDGSDTVLDELARGAPGVRVLHLTRNFGQQAALHAGLQHARGDAVVVMDADLQDDPHQIPRFLEKWREGYDVVYAIRTGRKEAWFKRAMFYCFYRILNRVAGIRLPLDAGNFGLIDRRAARAITAINDCDRYYAGLRGWVGFQQTGVVVERGARYGGAPKASFWDLLRLARTALISFSSLPLTMFYALAAVSLIVMAALCAFTLYHKLITGLAIPGWTSHIITASFFGAINALGIAILGEYVLKIYNQVRARPIYLVERIVSAESLGGHAGDSNAAKATAQPESGETGV
jgi:dolichol-phosphate mannosyltransferase